MYLVLKELIPIAEDCIIATAPLTKDMTSPNPIYRANAIRVLCKLAVEPTILPTIERYMRQSLVDKEPSVASAALVTGVHMMRYGHVEYVKRWVSEVQAALQSKSSMVQYHALGLLYQIKKQDSQIVKGAIRSPHAHCLLIRFCSQVIQEDRSSQLDGIYEYLESCVRHKSEMVAYEAAKTICSLQDISGKRDVNPALGVLQGLLSSLKPTLRFAAVRTLNRYAMTYPLPAACEIDLENLINDSNRSIATLAITTLLKTGREASVDRLMKQISGFMSEISDEFKIVVVEAIRVLALKFPAKHGSMMNFLAGILRDEGGFQYKQALVNAILTIIEQRPDAKEVGLTHLCEFIEDCEFTSLSTKILYLLGKEGPTTTQPSQYIRYIYNRIGLENASVRASAVGALAKFGIALEHLRPSVMTLLRRCLSDQDDEVRDRATFYLGILQSGEDPEQAAHRYLPSALPIPLGNLEAALQQYLQNVPESTFDWTTVATEPIGRAEPSKPTLDRGEKPLIATPRVEEKRVQHNFAEELAKIPQLAALGQPQKSAKPIRLTEEETEYSVSVIKHLYANHFVLQFDVENTLESHMLENVTVRLETPQGWEADFYVTAPAVKPNSTASAYTVVKRPPGSDGVSVRFPATLLYTLKDIEPETGEPSEDGFEDEYNLRELPITLADYMQATFIPSWPDSWDELGEENEAVEVYSLSQNNLKDAVDTVIGFLGLHPCDKSNLVAAGKTKHILYLSGRYTGDRLVLARARMMVDGGVQLQLAARSADPEIAKLVASAL